MNCANPCPLIVDDYNKSVILTRANNQILSKLFIYFFKIFGMLTVPSSF